MATVPHRQQLRARRVVPVGRRLRRRRSRVPRTTSSRCASLDVGCEFRFTPAAIALALLEPHPSRPGSDPPGVRLLRRADRPSAPAHVVPRQQEGRARRSPAAAARRPAGVPRSPTVARRQASCRPAEALHRPGATTLATAALSVAYDLSYVDALREAELGAGRACRVDGRPVLIDGRLVPAGGVLRSDVAIVGAGPAGLTVAKELAGARHRRAPARGRRSAPHACGRRRAPRARARVEPFPLVRSRRRGFGGTSGHWGPETGLRIRPLDDIDFAGPRPPAPSMAGRSARRARVRTTHGPTPGDRDGRRTTPRARVVAGRHRRRRRSPAGPSWRCSGSPPHDTFTHRFDDADVDAVPRRRAALDGARRSRPAQTAHGHLAARRLPGRQPVHGRGRESFGARGRRHRQRARAAVLSPGRPARGIGNEHDNVGRYFMDHLSVDTRDHSSRTRLDVDLRSDGSWADGPESDRHQPMLWLGPEIIERENLLNAAFWLNEVDPGYLSPGVGAARSLRTAWHATPRARPRRHACERGASRARRRPVRARPCRPPGRSPTR